jgi:hypothetical protein
MVETDPARRKLTYEIGASGMSFADAFRCGFDAAGLPIGMQLVALGGARRASSFESETRTRKRRAILRCPT